MWGPWERLTRQAEGSPAPSSFRSESKWSLSQSLEAQSRGHVCGWVEGGVSAPAATARTPVNCRSPEVSRLNHPVPLRDLLKMTKLQIALRGRYFTRYEWVVLLLLFSGSLPLLALCPRDSFPVTTPGGGCMDVLAAKTTLQREMAAVSSLKSGKLGTE